jgi:small-conductance mechanosensitive channel
VADVSPSIPAPMTEMVNEILDLRARLAEAEAGHEMTRRELQRYQSHVHDADGFTAQAAQRALDATARAEAAEREKRYIDLAHSAVLQRCEEAEARLAEVEAERDYWQDISAGNENVAANFRAKLAAVEAERDELRDSLIAEWNAKREFAAMAKRAEARLAAVRDLCRREARWTEQGFGWITVDDVLALIDQEDDRD